MKRSNTMSQLSFGNLAGYQQKVAHHEAGHATAIHINNRLNNLPPVAFQIIFKNIGERFVNTKLTDQDGYIACINGGRLIQSLLLALDDSIAQSSTCSDAMALQFTEDYRLAFEADIVNLLIGPLAEAKFIYQMDDEPFNQQLLTVQALKNYGGDEDLAIVNDYLQSFSADQQEQKKILNQFFIQAFNFVNDSKNWKAIVNLANYILTSNKNMIGCEEIAVVLEKANQ